MITEKALMDTINYIKPVLSGWTHISIFNIIKNFQKNNTPDPVSNKYVGELDQIIFNGFVFRVANGIYQNNIEIFYKGKWKNIEILTNEERIIKEIIE